MTTGRPRTGGSAERRRVVTTSPTGVLVVGSASADVTSFSTRLPKPGETILGDDFTLVLGGKGANQAVAAARAGAPTRMLGCIGSDLFADLVADGLAKAGVELDLIHRVPGSTGIAHIRVDGAGQNDIVVIPLANSALSEEHLDAAFSAGAPARVLLTQLEIPIPLALSALRRAREAGLTTILDPAPAAHLDEAIWPLLDIVVPNESEAAFITGVDVVDEASAIAAGQWFVDRGVRSALITLAAAGAVLVTADGSEHFDAMPVDAIDTTAAGDAFAGYLGSALALGLTLEQAIPRAMAAGAIAVTRRGASPSIPSSDEVDAFLAERQGSSA